jgi:hypothetical protein
MIAIGTKFYHVDCLYNMELIDVLYRIGKTKYPDPVAVVKYIDRDKPDFRAPMSYLVKMFNYKRFIKKEVNE